MMITIKSISFLFVSAVLLMAQIPHKQSLEPDNVSRPIYDTVYVTGTETAYSSILWQANKLNKTLLVELDDTSSVGYASDSACVSIEMLQVWNSYETKRNVIMLASKAHPDSSSWPYSSSFSLVDSLDVLSMDTTAYWDRLQYPRRNANKDTIGYTYGVVLDSVVTDSSLYKACTYYPIVPDASPGIVFKFTGKASNKVGSAAMVRIGLYYINTKPTSSNY